MGNESNNFCNYNDFYAHCMRYRHNSLYSHIAMDNHQMNRIKEVLLQKGIKQKWLAEQLDKSYNMVNSYAQNRRQPSLEDLFKIAEILDVEAKELLIERKENQ